MAALIACLTVTLITAGALVAFSFYLARTGRPLYDGEREIEREEMREHLFWGLVYCNPDDPRGWVPKVRGYGWTVNARSRDAASIMALLAIATIVLVLLTVGSAARFALQVTANARQGSPASGQER